MADFIPGQRYPMTRQEAATVMRHGWPAVYGEPDSWAFWTVDGRKVSFDFEGGGLIVSQSRKPDPERPPPL